MRVWLTVRPNGDTGVGMAVPPVSGGAAGVPAISIPSLSVPSAPLSKKDLGTISLLGLPGIVFSTFPPYAPRDGSTPHPPEMDDDQGVER